MKFFQIIRYWFYITFKFGGRIGLFTFYYELRGERRYHLNSTAFNNLKELNLQGNQLVHATFYMPVSYFTMEQLLTHLPEDARKGSFLDIGCGKGRAMCMAAHSGFTKVKGIDFAKELIEAAEKNLERTKEDYPALSYELLWKDVTALTIDKDVSTVFLFNPFDEVLMKTVVQKIRVSLQTDPRPFYVLYASPRHEELFFAEGYDVIFRVKKFDYLEGVIFNNR